MSRQTKTILAAMFASLAVSFALNPILGIWRACAIGILASILVRLYLDMHTGCTCRTCRPNS